MSIQSESDYQFGLQPAAGKSAVAPRLTSTLALAALALTWFSAVASAQMPPTDAKSMCIWQPTEFAGWFTSGTITAGGAVNPADGLHFPGGDHCNYYKWAMHNFLWLTSPAAEGGGMTFESGQFFSVLPPASDGSRMMSHNEGGKTFPDAKIDLFALRSAKPVEHGGQPGRHSVLMARNGSLVYYSSQVNEVYAY